MKDLVCEHRPCPLLYLHSTVLVNAVLPHPQRVQLMFMLTKWQIAHMQHADANKCCLLDGRAVFSNCCIKRGGGDGVR